MVWERLGNLIENINERNTDLKVSLLLGVNLDKKFFPSIANIIGTDLSTYKIVRKGQFACKLMSVGRDGVLPLGFLEDYDEAIVSGAYYAFKVKDETIILPQYLMLCMSRKEFDRELWFRSGGDVRGGTSWEELCSIKIPVPTLEEQQQIVNSYKSIEERIKLKKQINDNLEAVLAASHSKMFFSMDTSEHSKLGELMTFGNGKSRPKTDGPIPVYGGNGVLSYTDHHNIENAVLIGRVGAYCGSVYLEQGICWVSDNAIFAKSKITKDEFFDYFLLKRLNLFNHHVGTGQQLLTQEILNNIEVPKPVTEQIELFNRKAASVFETIFTNSREIIWLQELSDLLLSRLAG